MKQPNSGAREVPALPRPRLPRAVRLLEHLVHVGCGGPAAAAGIAGLQLATTSPVTHLKAENVQDIIRYVICINFNYCLRIQLANIFCGLEGILCSFYRLQINLYTQ